MTMVQARRPNFWDMQADLKKFSVPLLIISGDEDESCLDGSVLLKRLVPTAACWSCQAPATTSPARNRPPSTPPSPTCSPPPKPAAGSRIGHRCDLISAAAISIDIREIMMVERPFRARRNRRSFA
jgi:hypothetical protein